MHGLFSIGDFITTLRIRARFLACVGITNREHLIFPVSTPPVISRRSGPNACRAGAGVGPHVLPASWDEKSHGRSTVASARLCGAAAARATLATHSTAGN